MHCYGNSSRRRKSRPRVKLFIEDNAVSIKKYVNHQIHIMKKHHKQPADLDLYIINMLDKEDI